MGPCVILSLIGADLQISRIRPTDSLLLQGMRASTIKKQPGGSGHGASSVHDMV